MARGALVCGTFLTMRALLVIASLFLLVLILGSVSLGFGVAMHCSYSNGGYSYYNDCHNTKLSLLINGGVLTGFTVMGLVFVAVLVCRVKEAPGSAAPTIVTQPYTVMPASSHGTALHPGNMYPARCPDMAQQASAAASISERVDPGHS